jgi:predicted CXXCH cytochrome family protein
MNKRQCGRDDLIYTGTLLLIMIAAVTAIALADEKKDIPDHTDFQICQPCHAEKQSQWEASGHGKAIAPVAGIKQGAADCSSCHTSPGIEAAKESYHKVPCLACHSRQKTAFEHRLNVDPEKLCTVCHTQKPIFWGLGAKGIEEVRNFHSGVPCISCHMTEANHSMKVLRPDDPGLSEKRLDTCTACHKDNNREGRVRQIQEWQKTYDESMKPLLADIKAVDEALNKKPDVLSEALKSKLEDARANLTLIEKDGSRGFHNFVFMMEITDNAERTLKEIKAAVK